MSKTRVFGCLAYVHEKKQKQYSKLSKREVKGVFVGAQNGACHIRDAKTSGIRISKHVRFDETVFPAESMMFQEMESNYFREAKMDHSDYSNIRIDKEPSINEINTTEIDHVKIAENQLEYIQGSGSVRRCPSRARSAPNRYVSNVAKRGYTMRICHRFEWLWNQTRKRGRKKR